MHIAWKVLGFPGCVYQLFTLLLYVIDRIVYVLKFLDVLQPRIAPQESFLLLELFTFRIFDFENLLRHPKTIIQNSC